MKNLTIAGALAALIFAPLPAMAQAGGGMTVVSGASCPVTAVVAVGNNRPLIGLTTGTLCTSGSGGGGGSNAAAGLTGAAVPTSAGYTGFNSGGNLVGVSSANPLPITGSLTANQSVNEAQINGVTPLMGNGTTGTGSQRVTLASDNSALPAAGQGATGAAVPAGATASGGKDGSGNLQTARVDSSGGMIGGTLTGTATRTVLTASASTALPGGATTTRPSYLRVTIETTLAANLFLCLANQTCSATVYDEMIPSGATAGTRLFEEIPFTAAVTYFTTGTPTVNATRLAN